MISWKDLLHKEKELPYFKKIINFIRLKRKLGKKIYPPDKDIFYAFKLTNFNEVKVVILGQDPYHKINQAHGLSFSVRKNVSITPSLKNIYKELSNDIPNFTVPNHGCLVNWALQGVFLLNSILTVESGISLSHANIGWTKFTDLVIKLLNEKKKGIIFLLWGEYAKKKSVLIDKRKHFLLKTSHPSPFSAHKGFLGCSHFSKTNYLLLKQGIKPINWSSL